MRIWRLMAHHENGEHALELMMEKSRVAIGWSKIDDLNKLQLDGSKDIASAIKQSYPNLQNSQLGGPSLWNLYRVMQEDDLVIVNVDRKRKCVFQVNGPYFYDQNDTILNYSHQRLASLTSLDAEELWQSCDAKVAEGENIRWTLAACAVTSEAKNEILKEGRRFSIQSSSIERNPVARKKCIEHYKCKCFACGFDFEKVYGELGKGFIHVHHRTDLSLSEDVHSVNYIDDLIPLCPNCHAMVHKVKPAMSVEKLIELIGDGVD